MTAEIPHRAPPSRRRPLRTVLIGTSLQEESDALAHTGLALARAAGARVVLLHALEQVPAFADGAGATAPAADPRLAWSEERLRAQAEGLGLRAPELERAEIRLGPAHRVLSELAEELAADLVVVGATTSGPLAAELLGSTADRVLRKAGCPVLVVRGERPLPPRSVLAPVDLSPLSADAFGRGLDLLGQLAPQGAIEVRAVYAVSFFDALEYRELGEGAAAEARRRAAEALRRFVLDHRPEAPFEIATELLQGEARFEILNELERRPADLVLLGTHGRGGMDRLLLGSVAATVARKAPCSVLMVPPQAADSLSARL